MGFFDYTPAGALYNAVGGKDTFFGKEGEIKQMSRLNANQKAVDQPLSDYLANTVGQGLTRYGGPMTAGISPYETQSLGHLASYLGQDRPATMEAASGALQRALSGQPAYDINPQITEQFIQDSLYAPARREFDTRTLPQLQESFAGAPSNFYTSARRDAESNARGDLETQLASQASNLRYQDELARRQSLTEAANRTNTALGYSPAISQADANFNLNKTAAGQTYGALPRVLEQQAYDRELQEFIRTQAENNPAIQQALQYLNTQTTDTVVQPGTEGLIGPLLGAAGTIGGAMIGGPAGAAIGGQIGSSFGSTPNTPLAVTGQYNNRPTNSYAQLTR